MVLATVMTALIAYILGGVRSTALIARFVFHSNLSPAGSDGYTEMLRRYKWRGVIYALVADFFKALLVAFIGGRLFLKAGFPSIGKQLALLFILVGQAMPVTDGLRPRTGVCAPLLTLLVVDWRCMLIGLALLLGLYLLTKKDAMGALGLAVAYPVCTLLFGGWWLKVLLAALCALALIYPYRAALRRCFAGLGQPRSRRPQPRDEPPEE